MIFNRTSTDICVSFEGMNAEDEKSLAETLYLGIKEIRNLKTSYMNWSNYAKEHNLIPILSYLRMYYSIHPYRCKGWDRAMLWEDAYMKEGDQK